MFDISIDELKPSHIQDLVKNQEFESQHLEFKRQLPVLDNKESVATMCGDITAFGNASGGYLIYGIGEARSEADSANCASAIFDTSVENEDSFVLRMSQIVQAGIEPRGFGVRIRVITCDEGKSCRCTRT